MKKAVSLLLALIMVFALAACGAGNTAQNNAAPANNAANETYNVKIRLAWDTRPDLPTSKLMEKYVEEVEKRSNKQITFETFPNAQLSGNNAQKTAQLLTDGDIDMAVLNSVTTKRWEIFKFPYLFSTLQEAYKCEDGASGRYMLDTLKEDANTYGLTYLDVGFRVFTGKESFADVKKLEGKKVRIINSRTFTEFVQALKATPVTTSMGELYQALQTGAADCQENPYSTISSQGFHNVNPYITNTNHVWAAYVLGANLDFWNELPEAARKVLEEVGKEIALEHRKMSEDSEASYRKKMESEGATFIDLTADQLKAWVAVGRSTHKNLVDLVGSETIEVFYKDLGLTKNW